MNRRLIAVGSAVGLALLAAWRDLPSEPRDAKVAVVSAQVSTPEPSTRHVAVPDDAADWYLLISHSSPKSREQHQLLRWFSGADPRLTALWNDPRVKAATTGPGYRGYREMWYAAVLHPPAIALLDATGERIYLARGSNVPSTATGLVRALNVAISDYHVRHRDQRASELQRETSGIAATTTGASLQPAGRLRPLTWPFKLVRWIFGRRPCPQVPDQPSPPIQPVEPTPREPIATVPDNADETSTSRPWLSYLVSLLLGGGLTAAWKMKQELGA